MVDTTLFKLFIRPEESNSYVQDDISKNVQRRIKEEIAVAPCDTCSNNVMCESKQLACRYYAMWVNSRTPKATHSKEPNKTIYNQLFNGKWKN